MKKNIDVLIVARPDHSMQIYNALLKQDKISFLYLSYKIFPKWVKRLTGIKKLTTVSKNAICSWRLTVVNLCRFKFKFPFAQNWDETRIFDSSLKTIFKENDIKLIHYWPEYGDAEILRYVKSNKDAKAFADVHMPHPKAIFEAMKPVYERYGIEPKSTQLYRMSMEQSDFANNATDILVPSSYVADTYRQIYNDKRFHVVSYGITLGTSYTRRKRTEIKEFVYAGRISLEKGSDLLLAFFEMHPELNIHLFGGIIPGQETIFNKYRDFSNIYFHGSVPKAELQEKMKHYDVGIHLSRFDAYSLAVGEMIGAGLPVIVSEYTGNKDDISKYNLGMVTDLDSKSIETVISSVIKLEIYNNITESIDNYIHNNISYGEKMIDFYSKFI